MKSGLKIIGLKNLTNRIAKLKDLNSDAVLLQSAQTARNFIYNRATAGFSVDGSPFEDYAPQTVRIRQASGRNIDTDRLVFTGDMMKNMQGKGIKGGAVISFENTKEKLKALDNQERFNWFGLSTDEAKKTRDDLAKAIELMKKRLAK